MPDDLATTLKRVSPFKELANKAATFRQALSGRLKSWKRLAGSRLTTASGSPVGRPSTCAEPLAPAERPRPRLWQKPVISRKFQIEKFVEKNRVIDWDDRRLHLLDDIGETGRAPRGFPLAWATEKASKLVFGTSPGPARNVAAPRPAACQKYEATRELTLGVNPCNHDCVSNFVIGVEAVASES
jgi:hypothetical protein